MVLNELGLARRFLSRELDIEVICTRPHSARGVFRPDHVWSHP